ncbi:hypothetical protein G7Y89_g3781 [Cudoniella acicularis]|uniref:Serine/threonine-protein kinase Tel1 n=1 Tax=Cudoniella acicularis TaxID=354080 RepID=A0A8H4W824_9HELO|nr:hypothetical protein G7Y89_g3781 [Cudoniella acicularis]
MDEAATEKAKSQRVHLLAVLTTLSETDKKSEQNDALKAFSKTRRGIKSSKFSSSQAVSEKHSYLAGKKTSRSASLTRLTQCAELIRLVVKAGAPKLWAKTAKAIVEHIVQTVPNAAGEFCAPIVSDYFRTLCALLEHQAHVERLKHNTWIEAVDFCLQGLNEYIGVKENGPVVLSRTSSNLGTSLAVRTVPRSSATNGQNRRNSSSLSKQDADEALQAIHSLVAASNAPLHARFREIIDTVVRYLHLQGSSVGRVHQLAFSAINNVLSYTRIDQTSFSLSVAMDVIPAIYVFWQSKTLAKDEMLNSVRDEMLMFLFAVHPHLERGIRDARNDSIFTMLEGMADALRADYGKRASRDQLQLDDLDMVDLGTEALNNTPFSLKAFRLRSHNNKAERNWAILQIVGLLERLVSLGHQKFVTPKESEKDLEDDIHPRKRQRVVQSSDRILEPLKSPDERLRLASLQMLPFILANCQKSASDLQEILDLLESCASDKRGTIAAWTLLAIASCTFQKCVTKIEPMQWIPLWHLGTRALTFSSTCRAASLLLHAVLARQLLQYQDIGKDVSAIITVADISGPVVLCDSAIFLMIHLLQLRITEVPSASLLTSHHVIRWMFARWNPTDKSFSAHYAMHVKPHYIMSLLRTSLGLPRAMMNSYYTLPMGRLEQAWQHHLDTQDIVRYILLLEDPDQSATVTCSSCPKYGERNKTLFVLDTAHFSSTRKLILELLVPKCGELSQSWKSYTEERVGPVSTETFRSAIYCCITMLLAMPHFSKSDLPQLRGFEETLEEFYRGIIGYLADADINDPSGTRALTETLLQSVQPYLPLCKSSDLIQLSTITPQLLRFFVTIAEDLTKRRPLLAPASTSPDNDRMDIDDDFDDFSTQESHGRVDQQKVVVPRRLLALDASTASFYFIVFGRLLLIAAISITPEYTGFMPSVFVQKLVQLSHEELLLARPLLHEIIHADLAIDSTDATSLVGRMGEILESDDFDRCEVALSVCLDLLVGLGHLWSAEDATPELVKLTSQLYEYFIAKALGNNILSPDVQKGVADLLLFLLREEPGYGERLSLPSARSSLFDLLQKTEASVKFYIGNQLPTIFRLFLLHDHEDVFLDILNNLPSDSVWREGISFRVFVFSKLASAWPTLLRRCIYHIFEVAGRVPECIDHASRCLSDVSSSLKLSSARELFALFAPQLLYTWLEEEDSEEAVEEVVEEFKKEDISSIPYQIFGFPSLQDLVLDAQEEVVGLMMMRGQDAKVEEVAKILGVEVHELLRECFTKIMAYTIAYDASRPLPPSSDKKRVAGDVRVKRRLGSDLYLHCVNLHFADIVALLYNISDPQDNLEKYLRRNKEFVYAANIFTTIKSTNAIHTVLPPNQQPTFKAKYLTTEINYLCSKTEFESAAMYTPALVTFVARKLSITIHPALGSLHACSVLRKLRVLICLAGDSAIKGYPVEMLLHTIRPFINDPQCADDAISLTEYLLNYGSDYLSQTPSFVAGISLSILGSMRALQKSDRSSSTQESQHKTTKERAKLFHEWFSAYLNNYSKTSRVRSSPNFCALLDAALNTEWMGNADTGTPESNLLIQLLQDEHITEKMLSRPSRKLALQMLCSEFHGPASFRNDVLGDDQSAIDMVVMVWKSCRGESASKEYLSWAARVLGRAFVASGHIDQELLRESALTQIKELSTLVEEGGSSRVCVLNLLRELTLGYEEREVGLAEAALRFIMTTSDETLVTTCQKCLGMDLYNASVWTPYQTPPSEFFEETEIPEDAFDSQAIFRKHWLRDLSIALALSVPKDTLLSALVPALKTVHGFAERAFPFIIHLVLSTESQSQHATKKSLSTATVTWFGNSETIDKNNLKVLINAILYLRTQPIPNENSSADRLHWLSIDYLKAAKAATHCGMFKTALLFAEEHYSAPVKSSRRSSVRDNAEQNDISGEMLLTIFQNIDDPDLYYGVQQKAGLDTILARFEYERDGTKGLAFRGAQYDSHIRKRNPAADQDAQSLVKALEVLSLSGLSHSLLQAQQSVGISTASLESMFRTARKLEQWDIPVPSACENNALTMYKAFQTIHTAADHGTIRQVIDEGLNCTMTSLVRDDLTASDLHGSLQTLAALVELDEVLSAQGSQQIEHMLERFEARSHWMKIGRFDDVSQILSCRGTTLSTINQQLRLRNLINVELVDTRLVEVRASLLASTLNRAHSALQESLSLATSMMDLIPLCSSLSLHLDAAIHVEAANALWDQGEMASSIGMLQALDSASILKRQNIPVGRSDLLSKIGHQVSVARLEKADKILEKYLKPALKDLKGRATGSEAGQVFHQFAAFCDQQLGDPDSLEDLERLKKLSKGKKDEVEQWETLLKTATSTNDKTTFKHAYIKAKTWSKLDDEELQRHISSREEFLRQSLENYLLSLAASDNHDSTALRFSALWLEHADESLANDAVSGRINGVPSRKFAPLMNQLTSRLQDSAVKFQQLLFVLVLRICTEHPYHGMYVIYAGMNNRPSSKDEAAISRRAAARKVASQLGSSPQVGQIWGELNSTNKLYCMLAGEKDDRYKSGRRVYVKDSPPANRLNSQLSKVRIPPPTMQIPLSPGLDYSRLPVMSRLEPHMSIASGVSAPKIITAIADNGAKFKQLVKDPNNNRSNSSNNPQVKGGSDDLRQDAIMEQVFEQVSELLKINRSTRQRNLNIRTYKVLPLTSIAGVIEFVPNTIPLHDYLMPAHERYYPKDLKGSQCRTEISGVADQSNDIRVKKFRSVTEQFHPVMRYFFTERFTDPDEWFVKRLAYTRSTAAISILGHVLGLGDRHGHNILLDAQSGEVVHIDLGVAFEMGRVLRIPEVVPFRLTRDIVDGMGITKTEGVFRRCCEFTLEALRKEVYSIMTILDVLRYDPLYSWSISPVRLANLQKDKLEDQSGATRDNIDNLVKTKEVVNEPGEADRALTVVNKKLSKTLSVTATVNDLINQAGDERNLAVLFSGGSAANNLVDVFGKVAEDKGCSLSYELIRVFGGPGIGDVRSRLVRLIPEDPTSLETTAIKILFNHRLASESTAAREEWLDIVEARHPLWTSISSEKRELIRSFLNTINLEIVKRARPSSVFNFQSASVGNLFLTGARLFTGSFESGIYLLGAITGVPNNVNVIPAINSNFSHHISAGLKNGTVITGQNSISHPSAPTAAPVIQGSSPQEQEEEPMSPLSHTRKLSKELSEHDHIEDANLPGSLPTLRKQYISFHKTHTEDLPSPIERIWYINPYGQEIRPAPNPKVIGSIQEASCVIYSIGSLYTSVIPSLILRGVGNAIRAGNVRFKILILNGSLDRETRAAGDEEFGARDFIAAIGKACQGSEKEVDEGAWKEYVTHVIHLQGEGTPRVEKEELGRLGVESVRIYGRRNEGGEGMIYDGTALGQALEAIIGRRDPRGDKLRRNTLGVS